MSHMVLWLVVAAVMALIEAFSFGLITMWFVVGALVAFVADLLGANFVVQVALFLVVSVLCLVLLRPVVVKHRNRGHSAEPTLVGERGVVCGTIDNDDGQGRAFRSYDLVGAVGYGGGPSCGHARRGRCPGVHQAHRQTV